MATLAEIEREIERRRLGTGTGGLTLDAVEQEIARRRAAATANQTPAQAVSPAATVSQPVASPVTLPAQPQAPGLLSQIGQAVSGLTGFDEVRQAGQQALNASPAAQGALQTLGQATAFNEAPQAAALLGGERGATIAGAEGAGRFGGGAIGGALAGPLGILVGQAIGGAAGAGIGTWLDRLSRGEKVTAGDVAFEAGASAVPDIMLAGGRQAVKAGQKLLSRTSRGIKESENLAAKHLRDRAETILRPPSKAENDQLWSMVHASGDRLSPNSLQGALSNMTDRQWEATMQRVRRVPAPPGSEITDFGEAAERVMTRIRDGKKSVQPLPLSEMQHLRSQVQKAKMSVQDGATKDSLQLFQDAIDDAMLDAKSYVSGGGDVEILLQAREGFRKIKETEEVAELMWNVTSKATKGDRLTVNLGRLSDALKKPRRGMQERAVAALQRQPGAINELTEFLDNMNKVDITPGALSALTGGIGQGLTLLGAAGAAVAGEREEGFGTGAVLLLSNILAAPAARARFTAIVLRNEARTGTRTIALPMLATLANMARREALGTTESP